MSIEDQLIFTGWVVLAVALGSILGVEREFRGHEAGLRTLGMVCGGAALFGRMGFILGEDRIAAGVVQGVGFLGAGLILHRHGGQVRGATSAALVWVVAGIGLAVGHELWVAAIVITLMYLGLLELGPVSDRILRAGRRRRAKEYAPRE